jgi:hypothetical protein
MENHSQSQRNFEKNPAEMTPDLWGCLTVKNWWGSITGLFGEK